jgi:hypothetical protein
MIVVKKIAPDKTPEGWHYCDVITLRVEASNLDSSLASHASH